MRVLIQRVTKAEVTVKGRSVSDIEKGLLLFVGIQKDDNASDLRWMADKIAHLRIFEDQDGKMNITLVQMKGSVLSVPQFTLCADMRKGTRPSFDPAAQPTLAKRSWMDFNNFLREGGILVKEGEFAASMQVCLTNDGPVTFWLDSRRPSD